MMRQVNVDASAWLAQRQVVEHGQDRRGQSGVAVVVGMDAVVADEAEVVVDRRHEGVSEDVAAGVARLADPPDDGCEALRDPSRPVEGRDDDGQVGLLLVHAREVPEDRRTDLIGVLGEEEGVVPAERDDEGGRVGPQQGVEEERVLGCVRPGVLVVASERVAPRRPEREYLRVPDDDWAARCEAALPELRAALGVDPLHPDEGLLVATWAAGGATAAGSPWPDRVGYWLGRQAVTAALADGLTLPEVLALSPEGIAERLTAALTACSR